MAYRNGSTAYDYRGTTSTAYQPSSYIHGSAVPSYEPVYVPYSTPVTRKVSKPENAVKTKPQHLFNIKTIMLLCVITALAFCVAFRSATMTQMTSQINKANTELAELQAKNQQLRIEIEKNMDLKSIEAFAITELGMTRPEKYQTIYINLNQKDMVEKPAAKENSGNGFFEFLNTIWAYFA